MADVANFDKASLAWTLPWDADWVTSVCFLGSTRRLAAGNNLGQILLWDLPDKPTATAPAPLRRLEGHSNVITRLAATADGRWLISASNDHTIRFWDMQSTAQGSATVALNAQTRADLIRRTASKVPALVEVRVETQTSARTFTGHKEWVTSMTLSRDDKLILSGDDGGQVILWNRADGKEVCRWRVKGWACAVALSPDNKQALVSERLPLVFDSGRHHGIKFWDASSGQVQRDLGADFKDMYIAAAAYAADGNLLAVGRGGEVDGQNGKVYLLDPAPGKRVRELTPGHEYGLTDLVFHPDGKHLASSGRDTRVRIWSSGDGKLVKELGKGRGGQFKDWIHAVSFSADGRWLAAADMAGAVQVWSFL